MRVLIKLTEFGSPKMWAAHVLLLVLCVLHAHSYKIGLSIMCCKPDKSEPEHMVHHDSTGHGSVHLSLQNHYRSELPSHQHALGHSNTLSVRFQFAANMLGSNIG